MPVHISNTSTRCLNDQHYIIKPREPHGWILLCVCVSVCVRDTSTTKLPRCERCSRHSRREERCLMVKGILAISQHVPPRRCCNRRCGNRDVLGSRRSAQAHVTGPRREVGRCLSIFQATPRFIQPMGCILLGIVWISSMRGVGASGWPDCSSRFMPPPLKKS